MEVGSRMERKRNPGALAPGPTFCPDYAFASSGRRGV